MFWLDEIVKERQLVGNSLCGSDSSVALSLHVTWLHQFTHILCVCVWGGTTHCLNNWVLPVYM